MKASHVEGVANRDGLESCGATGKEFVGALTEERAGWVLSRENMTLLRKQQALQGADALETVETVDGNLHRGGGNQRSRETTIGKVLAAMWAAFRWLQTKK